MGNCNVSRSAREERYMGVDGGLKKNQREPLNKKTSMVSLSLSDSKVLEPPDPFSTYAEATEQESSNSSYMGDATAPLSPEFSLSPPHYSIKQEQSPYIHATALITSTSLELEREADDEAQDLVSPLAPSPRRSRAFQARLQKARHLQMALNNNSHNGIHRRRRSGSPMLTNNNNISPLQQIHHGSSMSVASTISANSSVTSMEETNSQAPASLNDPQPTVESIRDPWASVILQEGVVVLCTALSRQTASLSQPRPPLFMATGTNCGSVVVQELLRVDLPELVSQNNTSAVVSLDTTSKLGPPVTIQLATRVRSLDFSPDGRFLSVGGDDGKCRVYQLKMDASEMVVNNDDDDHNNRGSHSRLSHLHLVGEMERVDRVTTIQFSPNSKYLAVGGFDGMVAIFETNQFTERLKMDPLVEIVRDGLVLSLDWSPDNCHLAFGGSDKCCAIVDCDSSWKVVREIRRKTTVQAVQWYPTGKFLAIGTADMVAIVVGHDSFATMNEIALPKNSRNRAMCWSPNGGYFIVCATPRTCQLYETKSFTMVHDFSRSGDITSLVWAEQSTLSTTGTMPQRYLAIAAEDGKVVIVKTGVEVSARAESSTVGDDYSTSLASSASYFSTRGDWVLKENTFKDCDTSVEASIGANGVNITVGDNAATVLTVAFSRGSKSRPSAFFAHATDDGMVTVRQTTDWKVVAEIQFPKPVPTMTFSMGSGFLALGCFDSNVYISDTTSNWELVAKIEFPAPITALRFGSKHNERLAVGTVDGALSFLDCSKGFDFAGEIDTSNSPVLALDWSTQNLAVGREDGAVAVYETKQVIKDVYESVTHLDRKTSVTALSFGVSSRFLAVGGIDGLLGIYSAKGGWVLCHQLSLDRSLSSVLWCPLGRHMAYGSESGQITIIDTVFWAEVGEAKIAASDSEDRVAIQSNLAFSQDGKLFAFSRSDLGFGVKDSTKKWNFVLNMLDYGKQSSDEASAVSNRHDSKSSISSKEDSEDDEDDEEDEDGSPMEDDGEGRYEV